MFTKTSMLVAGIMTVALSVLVWAVTAAQGNDLSEGCACPNIVDANSDGVCDRIEDGSCPGRLSVGAGCGQCQRAENCSQFVDENRNGICDRREQGACPCAQGCGKCAKLVDANGEGGWNLQGCCPRAQGTGCGQSAGCGRGAPNAVGAWDAFRPWVTTEK